MKNSFRLAGPCERACAGKSGGSLGKAGSPIFLAPPAEPSFGCPKGKEKSASAAPTASMK